MNLIYVLALQNAPRIGDITAKKLIRHCGSAEAVFKEKKSALLKIDGVGSYTLEKLYDASLINIAENEIQFIKKHNIVCHYFLEKSYPEKLKHCIDGPLLLFQKGNIDLKNRRIISVVGTRNITTHGAAFCEKLINKLAPYNPIIVSGFAYGTDITAHKVAMKSNLQTIGCLAHGFDQVYPKVHKKYCSDIEKNGGFFTDFWSKAPFDRKNFLKRNRIIAGLSEATIVIESAAKGGSLVTADIANSYNREVFAVPGRSTDSQSIGCNNLIKFQKAHLLSVPEDVAYILNWQLESTHHPVQKKLFIELKDDENIVYNFLNEHGKETLDIIALKCNYPTFKTVSILLNLELKGVVRPLPGKLFEVV